MGHFSLTDNQEFTKNSNFGESRSQNKVNYNSKRSHNNRVSLLKMEASREEWRNSSNRIGKRLGLKTKEIFPEEAEMKFNKNGSADTQNI